MKKEQQSFGSEQVIKEYPNSTYLLIGNYLDAIGNLILTSERLVFLIRAPLSDEQFEETQRMAQEATANELIDFALTLHKNNFQIPLEKVISAKMGLRSYLPLAFCLRVFHMGRGRKIKDTSFMFQPPMMKRLMMSEFPTMGWARAINKAAKKKQSSWIG